MADDESNTEEYEESEEDEGYESITGHQRARAHISWHNWSQATSAASSPDDIDFIF